MLVRNVDVGGERVDVRIKDGLIEALSDHLPALDHERVVEGKGGALLPGLHDHHIHLNATAAALQSVHCGPTEVEDEQQLIAALHRNPGGDWLRGIGYHPSVAGEIDRDWLDKYGPDRPVRIQHRSGRMWIFNSRAIAVLDANIPDDGRLVDGDVLVRQALGSQRPDLGQLIKKLLSFGITGVTEVTPGNDRLDLEHYLRAARPLRLSIMGGEDLHAVDGRHAANIGPLKIHNHDHDLPPLSALTDSIKKAHAHGRAVAVHCVTRAELMLSLAAIQDAGPSHGDRIEHAAIADAAAIEWIKRLDLTVVTQPHFVAERGAAYLRDVDRDDLPYLWPLKSFLDAGIRLAAGSDAPFGDCNPWKAMASAATRPEGLEPHEAVTAEQALALYIKPAEDAGGEARIIEKGATADLCLLDRSWSDARNVLAEVSVRATWISGEMVYDSISSTRPQSSAV